LARSQSGPRAAAVVLFIHSGLPPLPRMPALPAVTPAAGGMPPHKAAPWPAPSTPATPAPWKPDHAPATMPGGSPAAARRALRNGAPPPPMAHGRKLLQRHHHLRRPRRRHLQSRRRPHRQGPLRICDFQQPDLRPRAAPPHLGRSSARRRQEPVVNRVGRWMRVVEPWRGSGPMGMDGWRRMAFCL
jgi:hypothetical protein